MDCFNAPFTNAKGISLLFVQRDSKITFNDYKVYYETVIARTLVCGYRNATHMFAIAVAITVATIGLAKRNFCGFSYCQWTSERIR